MLHRPIRWQGVRVQARWRSDDALASLSEAQLLRRTACGVFLLLLAVYLFTQGGNLYSTDGLVMYRTTEALATRHSIVLDEVPALRWQVVSGQHGLYFSIYGLGQPLLATIPFELGRALHALRFGYMYDQAALLYLVSLFSQVVTALTGALVVLLGYRLGYGIRLSAALALAWGLCTLAWPYSKTFFSEPLFTCCLVAAALGCLSYRQTVGRRRFTWLALAGFGLGYAVLTRAAGVMLVPPFVAYAVWSAGTHPEGAWLWARIGSGSAAPRLPIAWRDLGAATLAYGAPLGTCLALALWYNQARFGSVFNTGYDVASFDTPFYAGLAGLLFSPGKSIVLYVPLTALAVVAWPHFWRRQRATATLFAVIGVVTLVQAATWWSWWGGWGWGPRLLVPLLPFAVLALGPLLLESARARIAAWPLAMLGLVSALLGVLVDFNVVLADLQQRYMATHDGTAEPAIYWRLSHAPLVEHARALLRGDQLSLVATDFQRLGFHQQDARLLLALPTVALIASLIVLARVQRGMRAIECLPATTAARRVDPAPAGPAVPHRAAG